MEEHDVLGHAAARTPKAFLNPALLILPRMLELLGMQMAGPMSDIVMGIITFGMVRRYFRDK